MSKLEKVVFVADYIEPGAAPIPASGPCGVCAESDLDQAVLLALDQTIVYQVERGQLSRQSL